MCLLAVFSRAHEAGPLVVAANRDEWLARPAQAMDVLSASGPRILGGRDLVAGGTWLAVNEHGVVASLTNRPSTGPRDPARRSRGELPVRLCAHASARAGVEALAREIRAEEYGPCWILVGDRESLFYVDLTGEGPPAPRELPAGLHVLENKPLDAPSTKADAVRASLSPNQHVPELKAALASHETLACVHAGDYGTRAASIVIVPAAGAPRFFYSDGPPCRAELADATPRWSDPP